VIWRMKNWKNKIWTKKLLARSITPELIKVDNLIEGSTASETTNLTRTDRESGLEVTTTTVTKTETSRTGKTGNAITVIPPDTCKPIVAKERPPELL
jgi:hypothetical protein